MENMVLNYPQPAMQIYVPDFIEFTTSYGTIIVPRTEILKVRFEKDLVAIELKEGGNSTIIPNESPEEIRAKLGLNLNFNLTCADVKG